MTQNGHEIQEVLGGSIAEEMGIVPGDMLLSVNGNAVEDVFDYQFLIQDPYIELLVRKTDSGEEWLLEIEKDVDEDPGIVFSSTLMDAYRSCRNKCIFCFIDQNPPGMRETIYFKDDDARLSFLQGNYVTLTNMKQTEIDRIIRYHMEPINISFHTTDPELRCKMLNNRFAGDCLQYAQQLADAGIQMNGQIVLCKGWNDKEQLDRTIRDLAGYLPHLQSLSVVPVGLTRFRDGLEALEPFSPEECREVIAQVHRWQEELYPQWQTHFVHAADEWYLQSGEPIPAEETYDGYPQLENGVGRMRLLENSIEEALAAREPKELSRSVSLVTGTLITSFLEKQLEKIRARYPQVTVYHYPVRNDFYGERITVTGLVTGGDLIAQLRGKPLGETLLVPSHMLRADEDIFLDDVTVADVEEALQIPVTVVEPEGEDLCRCILGEERHRSYQRRHGYEQTDPGDRGPAERRKIDSF